MKSRSQKYILLMEGLSPSPPFRTLVATKFNPGERRHSTIKWWLGQGDCPWSFTIFQSPTPVTAPILRTWRHYWPFRRSTCDLQSSARLLLSRFLAQSGVGSRELLLGLVTQVCALTPRTRYRLQPFPSARRLVADRAPLTPANFRSSLAGLPPPPA